MILARIEEVGRDSLTDEQVDRVVRLLECLPANMDDSLRSRLLVPDTTGIMCAVADLHFNDTGSRPERLPPSVMSLTHPKVTESLARTLNIKTLASMLSTFSESGYMGESFVTSVRKALTDYNETQMIPEMLANAVDARATRFVLVLDEMPSDTENLISPNLGAFQQCPALLVYNDGEFTEDDLKGLCSTGEGSKANKRDSIGQFGRGALTMFHITEVGTRIVILAVWFF
jgi:sacsin